MQQSAPDHVLKIPKYGSERAALNASNAARSEGEHASTEKVTATKRTTKKLPASLIFIFMSECVMCFSTKGYACMFVYISDLP